jgi:hypothetical protein
LIGQFHPKDLQDSFIIITNFIKSKINLKIKMQGVPPQAHELQLYDKPKDFPEDCVSTWVATNFNVPWSGTDENGELIEFSDLKYQSDPENAQIIRVSGKDTAGFETLTGTFDCENGWATRFSDKGGTEQTGIFKVEIGDTTKKQRKLFLVVPGTTFKISMTNAVNWYNDSYEGNLDIFTTITQNGIFGFSSSGTQRGIGGEFLVIRGIRQGNNFNWQYLNPYDFRYNYAQKLIQNNDWAILTGDMHNLESKSVSNSEYFADLATMQACDLVGLLQADYEIQSQLPEEDLWDSTSIIWESPKRFPAEVQARWTEYLGQFGDADLVPWSGVDGEGLPVNFSDLKYFPDPYNFEIIRVLGKDSKGSEVLTGTFEWRNHWVTRFRYKDGEEQEAKFFIEFTDWTRKQKRLVLKAEPSKESPETPFKIQMENQLNWFDEETTEIFTTITQNGIFGFSQGSEGEGSFMVIRGIRQGNNFNWQCLNYYHYRYNYAQKLINNNEWAILTGKVYRHHDGQMKRFEHYADLATMNAHNLAGTLIADYEIRGEPPILKQWKPLNFDHRAVMEPVEDSMFRDTDAMPAEWDMLVWEGRLIDAGFKVRWEGTDSQGRQIVFDDLQINLVDKHATFSGRGYLGSVGDQATTPSNTQIYASGSFDTGDSWTLELKYHKNGQVTAMTVKGTFKIEEGDGWKNSTISLTGSGADDKFCIAMIDQRRWYNNYQGVDIPTFTVMDNNGIFGLGQSIREYLGKENFFFCKGIRKGNKFNWTYTYLAPEHNECMWMYSGDALLCEECCIIEGEYLQMHPGQWRTDNNDDWIAYSRKNFLEQAFVNFFRMEFRLRICRPLRNLQNPANYPCKFSESGKFAVPRSK